MYRPTSVWFFVVVLLASSLSSHLVHAAPFKKCTHLAKRSGNILLGWKGLRYGVNVAEFEKSPQASASGELGSVLYIADGTALARSFAQNDICEIYADTEEWEKMPKAWVSQAEIQDIIKAGSNAKVLPGTALFASHTAAGVQGDPSPWQLGVRPQDFKRLRITAKCYAVTDPCFATPLKLHYDQLSAAWHIHGHPERGH